VPRMGGFKRALLGYRRGPVDEAIAGCSERIDELEQELSYMSWIVLEKDRVISDLREQLRDANHRHDESLRSLEPISRRLDEIQAQARGQATRIRMKALREAVEVSRRVQELGDFSQLVRFEDAAGQIAATSEISVEKFSEGRATLAMRLDEPVELLRELEERAPFEFKVRHTGGDRLVLDVDEEDAQAA
jgi:DNA repair ATPase RecN